MKPLLAVFAHPDDEAFGPSGSLALWAKERDVYLICVTKGDAGQNSSAQKKDLGEIRRRELENSAQIIGVKKVYFLGYKDGFLSNSLYHEIAKKIEQIMEKVQADTLLTFDQLGISGHLDHIAVSMICSYIFKKNSQIKKILYYGELDEVMTPVKDTYFIFMPTGFKTEDVDLTININSVWETKLKAIRAHVSQSHDGEEIIKNAQKYPKAEYFKLLKK